MTDTTAEEVQALFQKLKTEHPGDFITVAEIRNAVLEEAAQALDAEADLSPFGSTYEAAASLVRSLKSGDSK
jgi:hypothetical protein